MAIDEIERTEMVQQLIDTLGEKPAATLMKCVYPNGTEQVATKDDLRSLEERMTERMATLEERMTERMASLEERMTERMASLEERTAEHMASLEERMRSYVDKAISTALARQTRMLMVTMAGFMLTIWVPLTVGALT